MAGAYETTPDWSSASEVLESARRPADRGDYERSLAFADRAIELDPGNPAAHVARGWALENLGRPLSEAGDAYRAALGVDDTSLWAAAGLATVAERLGEDDEAARLFGLVADAPVDPGERDPDVLEVVGWSRFKAGRFRDAQELFRRALEGDPSLTAVHLDLALVLLFSGNTDEALREYRAALDTGDAAEARAHATVALDDLEHAVEGHAEDGPPGAEEAADLLRSAAAGGAHPG